MTTAQRVCLATGNPQEDPYLSNAQSLINININNCKKYILEKSPHLNKGQIRYRLKKYEEVFIEDFEKMCREIDALECCAHISLIVPSESFRIKPKLCDQDVLFAIIESYFFDYELA